MKLWRVAAETRAYRADDLSGGGAAKYPGRWNDAGDAVVYSATSIALATLETAAHVDPGGLPLNRFLVEVNVPDAVWAARKEFGVAVLPKTWNAIPAGKASIQTGSDWLRSQGSLIALVPSVIVPEEWVALLNPTHANAKRLATRVVRRFEYHQLFRSPRGR